MVYRKLIWFHSLWLSMSPINKSSALDQWKFSGISTLHKILQLP